LAGNVIPIERQSKLTRSATWCTDLDEGIAAADELRPRREYSDLEFRRLSKYGTRKKHKARNSHQGTLHKHLTGWPGMARYGPGMAPVWPRYAPGMPPVCPPVCPRYAWLVPTYRSVNLSISGDAVKKTAVGP